MTEGGGSVVRIYKTSSFPLLSQFCKPLSTLYVLDYHPLSDSRHLRYRRFKKQTKNFHIPLRGSTLHSEILLLARPCIFQPGNFTGWGSEGVNLDNTLRDSTLRDSTLRDSSLRDSTLKDNTLRDNTLRDSTLRDNTLRDSTLRDSTLRVSPLSLFRWSREDEDSEWLTELYYGPRYN